MTRGAGREGVLERKAPLLRMWGRGGWRFKFAGQWPQEKNVAASVFSVKGKPRSSLGTSRTAP